MSASLTGYIDRAGVWIAAGFAVLMLVCGVLGV